jgi:hypothetical protein
MCIPLNVPPYFYEREKEESSEKKSLKIARNP